MNEEQYYELSLHEQRLIDREMTQKEYEALPDYEQRLIDSGLPTIEETKNYRKTVGWVPYEEYMERVHFHHPGRKLDGFNMEQDWCNKQLEPDRLLREAAYNYGLKYRNVSEEWTEEDQKILEEKLYTMFKEVVNCYK